MTSFWHPFAEMSKVQHNPFIVDRGEGIYVFDETGKRYPGGWHLRRLPDGRYRWKSPLGHIYTTNNERPP